MDSERTQAEVIEHVAQLIQSCLSDDLRRPVYQGNPNYLAGHCYVASEVAWHLLGGADSSWCPMFIRHECEPHWFLGRTTAAGTEVIDITASQFTTAVPYHLAKGKGFLTKEPSRRARIVLDRIGDLLVHGATS
jgi:hypothetical protein